MDHEENSEIKPRSTEEILSIVGMSKENLKGKSVLFFGNGMDKIDQTIGAQKVQDFDIDAFLMFDEVLQTGSIPDIIIGVDSPYLSEDISVGSRVDLLETTIRSLSKNGELRISVEDMDPDKLMGIIEDIEYALYDRALDVSISAHQSDEVSYLQVSRKN